MAKMYYNEAEAADKLGIAPDGLSKLARQAKLRVYQDGSQRMFRVDEVDALAASGGAGEIQLTPADSTAGEAPTLSEADRPPEVSKSDTVITSEGISIFDDEDLEIEAGDPMAKTAIAPSVDEQVSLEGVGSGSGLLDLTRESDDTSLGAEVLEHIDVESAAPGGSGVEGLAEEAAYTEPEPAVIEGPTVVEEIDAAAGAFSGLVLAAALVMLLVGSVVVPVALGKEPPYLVKLQENLPLVIGLSAVVSIILAVVGYLVGKAAADRAAALQRGG